MNERRQGKRLCRKYRVEYGPFSALADHDRLKTSALQNLGRGGLRFSSEEKFTVGSQIFLKIHIPGWKRSGESVEQAVNNKAELLLQAIAEVRRVDFDAQENFYMIGAKFSGQVVV